MIDETKLDIKYVVFKIKDINAFLTEYERKLLWSFLNKIIVAHNRIKETDKQFETSKELRIKQFRHDIDQIPTNTTITGKLLRELLTKYDIR